MRPAGQVAWPRSLGGSSGIVAASAQPSSCPSISRAVALSTASRSRSAGAGSSAARRDCGSNGSVGLSRQRVVLHAGFHATAVTSFRFKRPLPVPSSALRRLGVRRVSPRYPVTSRLGSCAGPRPCATPRGTLPRGRRWARARVPVGEGGRRGCRSHDNRARALSAP